MAPSRTRKLVQALLPASFTKVARNARVEKPKYQSKSSPKKASRKPPGQAREEDIPRDIPVLLGGGVEVVGDGTHQASCAVKILRKNSSEFFEGAIETVDKSVEAAQRLRQEAAQYPIISTSTVVKCQDGTPLLYFIKNGMFAGMSAVEQENRRKESLDAIRSLVKGYAPRQPTGTDSRSKLDRQEQKRTWSAKKLPWGKYNLIFNYPLGQPHKKPQIHTHSKPSCKGGIVTVSKYIKSTTWEHEQVSQWIKAIDPKKHQELHDCYQALGPEELKHLYQGPNACQSGLVLLVNMAVHPHKDHNDARDNWTTTNCWEDCEGGLVALAELGIRIDQKPGDLVIMHAAVLTHFVGKIENGQRFCHVRFTKCNILHRPYSTPQLGLRCPIKGCPKICNSEAILKTHLQGRKARGGKDGYASKAYYHFLERDTVKQLVEKTIAAYNDSISDASELADY